MTPRLLVPLFTSILAASAFLACTDDEETSPSETGGAGGEGGMGGSPSTSGGSSGAAGASAACAEEGTGELTVTVSGVPDDAMPPLKLVGPDGERSVDVGETISDLAAGEYTVEASVLTIDDPIVRTVYLPTTTSTQVCVSDGADAEIEVAYELVPSSHKLWIDNGDADAELLGLPASELETSGTPSEEVSIDAPAGDEVAFDRLGNLWAFGPTVSDPPLVRYAAADLGTSGQPEPNRKLAVADVDCIPGLRAMAFDFDGNLWVAACQGRVMRLSAGDLELGASDDGETLEADVVLSGLADPQDLAFDLDGNLYVADDGLVVRYAAARLDESTDEAPDVSFQVRNAADTQGISADFLTFDTSGNLWVTDFGGNFVARLGASDLEGSDADPLVAEVSLVLSVSALLDRPAFDESGGLWISYSANKIARIAPADLEISTTAGDPTVPDVVVEEGSIGNTGNVAFFPAPAGLPLYHALP